VQDLGATVVPIGLASSEVPTRGYHRDYLRIAAWLFAFLFGPALVAAALLLA